MKKTICILALGILVLAAGCKRNGGPGGAAADIPLFRHHFLGTAALLANTNATKLREISALPSTAAFKNEVLSKIARAPFAAWRNHLPSGAGDQAALLQPMLEDVLSVESVSELTGPTNQPDFVLVVKLSNERAAVWQTNLLQVASAWQWGAPRNVKVDRFQGWEFMLNKGSNALQVFRADDWMVVASGPPPLRGSVKMLGAIAAKNALSRKPAEAFLSVDADLPKWSAWSSLLKHYEMAPVRLTMSMEAGNIRTKGTFHLAERLAWSYEDWKIPTNSVDATFVSFTVAQGFGKWLEKKVSAADLGLDELPTQFCAWGLPTTHSQAFVAVPVDDATNAIRRLAPKLPPLIETVVGTNVGAFLYASNNVSLLWRGLPVLSPYIRPLREGGQDFLLVGLFPMPGRTNLPPPDLFQQLSERKDLLMYDWELTEHRSISARQIYRLIDLMRRRQIKRDTDPTQQWTRDVEPLLGNTVTELTAAGPKELALVRKSHIGLTGFELVTLVYWVESPGFPLTFESKPPMQRPTPAAKKP